MSQTMKIIITDLWIASALAFVFFRWDLAVEMKPNEWGDFTAGVFAPIAFLWLIFGYVQQGKGLKQNTHALQLQAEELKQMVLAQRMEVDIAQKSLSFQVGGKLFVTADQTFKTMARNSSKLEAGILLAIRTPGRPVSNVIIKIDSGPPGAELEKEQLGVVTRLSKLNLFIPWVQTEVGHKEEVTLLVTYTDPFGENVASRKLVITRQSNRSDISSIIYDEPSG